MRSTYKQLYYINRSKIKADGTTSIMCRVTIDGKAIVLATGLYRQGFIALLMNGTARKAKQRIVESMVCSMTIRIVLMILTIVC